MKRAILLGLLIGVLVAGPIVVLDQALIGFHFCSKIGLKLPSGDIIFISPGIDIKRYTPQPAPPPVPEGPETLKIVPRLERS